MSGTSRPVPADTTARQQRASHPQTSAWVSANAGSGKTHVLTQRVVRLLLDGISPARILCLTFTKAAAANMSIRVFKTLAGWATMSDTALARAIEGTGASAPGPLDLAVARKLFARTVETPGGLKIQTIHAFCERLLHLFPFEANVAARFEVLDDLQRQDLLDNAREAALAQAAAEPDSDLGRAVRLLADEATSFSFEALVTEALGHRETLGTALALAGSVADFGAGIGLALGLRQGEDLAAIEHHMLHAGLSRETWVATARILGADGGGKNTTGNRLAKAALATGEALLESYLDVFLTDKRMPREDRYLVQALRKAEPALCAALDAERDRLFRLLDKRRAAETLQRTIALIEVANAVLDHYGAAKRLRGLLDFDDLVERTRTLLSRSSAAWVLYKLDAGIDHVLVDEAQDTSPAQWDILRAITADFFAGAGQGRGKRTIFAVGDEKQSIFSFQGAEPARFDAMREAFEREVNRGDASFEKVTLNLSFRSTQTVLDVVDRVFARGEHARGLSARDEAPPVHVAMRDQTPGVAELWPALGPQPQPQPDDWRLPLDRIDPQSPAVTVAKRIADAIAALTHQGSCETVEDRATGQRRRITAGDVLILVRTRNAFFEAVIRALKDRQVPVAGADRLQLTEHIAVMDLMAAGRAALLPDDDLTLACVLKSPLFGLDDDDLIALAPERRGSLASALERSPEAAHRHAAALLGRWRERAAEMTPFGFYSQLLGADGGRRRMLARLGPEANDALDEFIALTLTHEREGPPSLLRFLARLDDRQLSVKRDMDAAGDAVRVMTVHAAKGLEAKIVFLADTCGAPTGRNDPALFAFSEPNAGSSYLAWSPRKDGDPTRIVAARQSHRQAAMEEHRRLLYVALTRAEERLYITGFHGAAGRADGCWYDMIASSDIGWTEAPAPWDAAETILQRRDEGVTAAVSDFTAKPEAGAALPAWATTTPAVEVSYAPPVRPSNALGAADQTPLEGEAFALDARTDARRQAALVGRLSHQLLQHLPDMAAEARAAAATRYLAVHGTKLEEARRASLASDILQLIAEPSLAPLFTPDSRAEVGVSGRVDLPARRIDVIGQIDRIAVTDSAVFIADFKTGRHHTVDTVPPSYIAQLGLYRAVVAQLYPGRVIRAFLVWTTGPTAIELAPQRLDQALADL